MAVLLGGVEETVSGTHTLCKMHLRSYCLCADSPMSFSTISWARSTFPFQTLIIHRCFFCCLAF